MATVTGLTAERMSQLALQWTQIASDLSVLAGKTNQLSSDVTVIHNGQLDLVNNQIPVLQQALSNADVLITDLNENQLPLLQADLDQLNTFTLPSLYSDLADANQAILDANSYASDTRDQLNALNATTLPGLNQALADSFDAEWATTFSTLFPITSTNIADDAITTPKLVTDAVVAAKIKSNEILARHILAGEIQTNHMAANSINADRILANTIVGDKIAANTITAQKLLVQGENLLSDPGFESGTLTTHQTFPSASWTQANASSGARTGTRVLQTTLSAGLGATFANLVRTGGATSDVTTTNHPKVTPGDILVFGFWVNAPSGTTLTARLQYFIRTIAAPTVNVATASTTAVALTGGWQFISTTITVPANSDPNLYIQLGLQINNGAAGNVILVDDMICRKKLDGSLIVDGTITTNHIISTGLSAGVIKTGTLDASLITVNNLSASSITSGTLNASLITVNNLSGQSFTAVADITGKTITGGTIQGSRFTTAAAGTRLSINDDEEAGSIKGYFDILENSIAPVLINPKMLSTGNAKRQVLYLSSGAVNLGGATPGGGVARVEIRSGSADNTTWPSRVYLNAQDVEVSNRLIVQAATTHNAQLEMATGNILFSDPNGGVVRYSRISTAGDVVFHTDGGMYWQSSSSTRAIKNNIEPLTLEEARTALAMEAVSFVFKPEANRGSKRQAGFIAEQAVAVGADLWVKEEPFGIHYAEVTAAHNVLIKDQQYRIERLESLVRKLLQNSQNGSES